MGATRASYGLGHVPGRGRTPTYIKIHVLLKAPQILLVALCLSIRNDGSDANIIRVSIEANGIKTFNNIAFDGLPVILPGLNVKESSLPITLIISINVISERVLSGYGFNTYFCAVVDKNWQFSFFSLDQPCNS
jgi:hypothetical protein